MSVFLNESRFVFDSIKLAHLTHLTTQSADILNQNKIVLFRPDVSA